jgi:UDP-N-acetylglucosamine 2-epimerase (non-hydrolysing)
VTQARSRILVHLVAAARPNFMKIAPLYHALKSEPWCEVRIVHTGQHYDPNMSDAFFRDLNLPQPDHHLEVGSGSHAEQTGGVMIAYEKIVERERPDWIVVVGDVNSTAACAIVGTKAWIPVVHLEAGLRSRDRRMPEEINRLVTDAIADVLWTPSPDADQNLIAEGVDASRIDFVGNIMIDSYEMLRPAIEASGAHGRLGLEPQAYGVVTLHRPSNVDDRRVLGELVAQLERVSEKLLLLFAVHPRTRKRLEEFGLAGNLAANARIRVTEPLGYIEFMNLVANARAVVTDSGGVQEETTYLGIPCLTLRENTERPVTVTEGSNRLAKPDELAAMIDTVLAGTWPKGRRPDLWDGHAAARCSAALKRRSGLR